MYRSILAAVALVISPFVPSAWASDCANFPAMSEMFNQDQTERQKTSIDWSVQNKRDEERISVVRKAVAADCVKTAQEFYFAAMLFQHGTNLPEIKQAYDYATVASHLDRTLIPARWLRAASFDRMLMMMNKPQWYGTQFVGSPGGYVLYQVDESAVTDADRQASGVPTLEQMREMIKKMNAQAISDKSR